MKYYLKSVFGSIIVGLLLFSATFKTEASSLDIDGHWAKEVIRAWFESDMIKGYTDGTFRPNNKLTRAELVTLINRLYSFTNETEVKFTDVKEDNWFYKEVSKSVAANYIKGYSDGSFKPSDEVTREEVAVILHRILKLDDVEKKDKTNNFLDKDEIGQWSIDSVEAVVNKGYMIGNPNGTFNPKKSITRAEIITAFDRALGVKKEYNSVLAGNFTNYGFLARNNGFIYYYNRNGKIYKVSEDKKEDEYFIETAQGDYGGYEYLKWYINVSDEYAYFIYDNHIYRSNLDGTNKKILNKQDKASNLILVGEYLYYTNYSDKDRIYRMTIDGSERVALTKDENCSSINVTENYIYYIADYVNWLNSKTRSIFRINLDGSEKVLLKSESSFKLIVKDDALYVLDGVSKRQSIEKINLDGTGLKVLTDIGGYSFNIKDDVIYYNSYPKGHLYSIRTDGTNRQKISDESTPNIHILGDYIYYRPAYGKIKRIPIPEKTLNSEFGLNEQGNRVGSIVMEELQLRGRYAYKDGYIYGVSRYGILNRFKEDGSEKIPIRKADGGYAASPNEINVIGEWVYYTDKYKRGLYRTKADGSGGEMIITDDPAYYVNIVGDWIYYVLSHDYTKRSNIVKRMLDGTKAEFLNSGYDEIPKSLNVVNDWIYYINTKDNYTVYRLKTDGTVREKINNERTKVINVMNNKIYYIAGGILKIMDLDGKNMKFLDIQQQVKNIFITEDKIYYSTVVNINGNREVSIYSCELDGSNKTFLAKSDYFQESFLVAGDYLYYWEENGNEVFKKIK